MKIKVKTIGGQVLPEIIEKGDWIDLKSLDDVKFTQRGSFKIVSLGVAMKLPKGFEAVVVARSSTYKNFKVFNPGSVGVIDYTYCGNGDIWKFPALAFEKTEISKGDRICQFRIQLSQKATMLQKLKWLFSNKIKIEQVDDLGGKNRGGIGSTGVK